MLRTASLALSLAAAVRAQQVGTNLAEVHPGLTSQTCTAGGSCTTQNTKVVLDANWRWLHTTTGYTNCYTGSEFDTSLCPDGDTCAKNCAVDGADYPGTYGVTASGNSLSLKFVTTSGQGGKNAGSRVYLMENDTTYKMYKLLNKEFTFDVDVSKLPCGLNGALYFVEMEADGGLKQYPSNKAGAKYGTGYCDAQCPRDLKFINGKANTAGWSSSPTDPNAGTGNTGSCCAEMDIWEANSISTAYTPHPCSIDTPGSYACTGTDCGVGARYSALCDKDGCDFNSYRMGETGFYGPGKTVDTKAKMTIVTQFITNDGTDTGDLTEIRRFYVQGGKVVANSNSKIPGVPNTNSLTDSWCKAQKTVFEDNNQFAAKGGMSKMGKSMKNGMVLTMSIWADQEAHLLWLDSTYPVDSTKLGAARGTCSTDSGNPDDLIRDSPDATVTFSNIKTGAIGSTFNSGGVVNPPPAGSTTLRTSSVRATSTTSSRAAASSSPAAGSIPKYQQCGGQNWSGTGACAAGSTCTKINDFYHQCL